MQIDILNGGYVKTIEDKIGCKYNDIPKTYDNMVNAVTSIAAITRGKDKSNNPEKRFISLLKEARPDFTFYEIEERQNEEDFFKLRQAGRSLEFVPLKFTYFTESGFTYLLNDENNETIKIPDYSFEELKKFSHIEDRTIYTNLRALFNVVSKYVLSFNKRKYNRVINSDDVKYVLGKLGDAIFMSVDDYFVAEIKAPYFAFAQLRTHGLITQVAYSNRYADNEDMWVPEDLLEKFLDNKEGIINFLTEREALRAQAFIPINLLDRELLSKEDINLNANKVLEDFFLNIPTKVGRELLKELGYEDEIIRRFPSFMEFKTWIVGGWLNNPYQWGHFLLERGAWDNNTHVQKATNEVAKSLRKLILNYKDKNGSN